MGNTQEDAKMAAASRGLLSEEGAWRHRRVLREHGHFPKSGKGGGKSAAVVLPKHRAKWIISFAASTAVEGPLAVEAIAPLVPNARVVVYRHSVQDGPHTRLTGQVQDLRGPDNPTFLQWLTDQITWSGNPGWRRAYAIHRNGIRLSFCVSPPSATLSWRTSDGIWTDYFLPKGQELPFTFVTLPEPKVPGHRVTVLPYDMIVAAGELWEETLTRYPDLLPPSSPVSAVPNADQENESAGGVPTPPAPSCDPNRVQAHGSETLTSPEDMEEREKSQPSPARGRVTSRSSQRTPRLSLNVPASSSRERPRYDLL